MKSSKLYQFYYVLFKKLTFVRNYFQHMFISKKDSYGSFVVNVKK
jgi:hypothetical protein